MSRDIKLLYSKSRINTAGKKIREQQQSDEDFEVIENWRASHNHILNSWQSTLRGRIKGKRIIFAQRLKRRITIFDKLIREPSMALANMHDVAGCRLIFQNIKELNSYRKNLHDNNRFNHILFRQKEDPYNYIENPRDSGYRGIHDVYIYKASRKAGEFWNGLKVEIQYRTLKQHAWATAVEIAGSITGNQSKFDRGSNEQKEFFKLTSEIIARAHENSKSCYPNLSNKDLIDRFHEIDKSIGLLRDLETLTVISTKFPIKKKTLILKSAPDKNGQYTTNIQAYDSLPEASKAYFLQEAAIKENEDLVLVRSESQQNIRKAYQNYFSDTQDFIELVKSGIKKLNKKKKS